jgi:hypothetical protein
VALPSRNGAQRQRALHESGADVREVFAAEVAATQRSYPGEGGSDVNAADRTYAGGEVRR